MRKRERLERAIAGEPVDRLPVALWRHFPGDDQRAADLARSSVDFQRRYDWDFLRLMPARHFQVIDYGLRDDWRGDPRGIRAIEKRVIQRSLDWTEIRPLSPGRGFLAQQVDSARLIAQALQADGVPILQTIYSPLVQAAQLAGPQKMLRDLRRQPERLRSALTQLTESTLRFLEALRKLPNLAGIFVVTEFASHDIMSEIEYTACSKSLLWDIFSALPREWWLNILQIGGAAPMLRLFSDLPLQAFNWDMRSADSLLSAKSLFRSAVCGGLSDDEDLLCGSPVLLRSALREAFNQSSGRRFILSGSGAGFITTPLSNLRAARASVDSRL